MTQVVNRIDQQRQSQILNNQEQYGLRYNPIHEHQRDSINQVFHNNAYLFQNQESILEKSIERRNKQSAKKLGKKKT